MVPQPQQQPQPQTQQQQQKRASESVEEDQAGPKAKKARATKAKAADSTGWFPHGLVLHYPCSNAHAAQSRRGQNTKKRGETAQIAGQSGKSPLCRSVVAEAASRRSFAYSATDSTSPRAVQQRQGEGFELER